MEMLADDGSDLNVTTNMNNNRKEKEKKDNKKQKNKQSKKSSKKEPIPAKYEINKKGKKRKS